MNADPSAFATRPFLEHSAREPGDLLREPPRAGAFASYDPSTKTLRLGLVIDHRPVDGCSLAIPLPPRS